MNELIYRLQRIAEKNGDEFRYRIDVEKRRNGLSYQFVAEETAERHVFLSSGERDSYESAIADAWLNIPAACKSWGYKE